MKYTYPDCKPFLTKREFLLEKSQLGPAFNKDNYFIIKTNKLNEGGWSGFIGSLPGILKIIVFGYDKIRDSVDESIEDANEVFKKEVFQNAEKVPVRTLKSMFDEDSHEDHPGSEFFKNYLKNNNDFDFTFMLRYCVANTGLFASYVEEWVKQYTIAGNKKNDHHDDHHGEEKLVEKSSLSIYFKTLSAIGHALHTIYTAISEKIIKAITLNTLPDEVNDFLANILFIVVLLCLLIPGFKAAVFAGLGKLAGVFAGKATAATVAKAGVAKAGVAKAASGSGVVAKCMSKCTNVVKVMEIIAEAIETGAIASEIAPKLKKVFKAGVFKTLFEYIFGVKDLPESLLPQSATTSGVNKLKDFGRSAKKQSRAPYHMEYMSDYVKDSYLRKYIGEIIIEMKIREIIEEIDLKSNKKIM